MGRRLLSLKGRFQWGGITRLHTNDRGQRQFSKLENVYVSRDGQELRHFPGFASIIDLTAINNTNGYERYVPDAIRPVLTGATSPWYSDQPYVASTHQSLLSRAKPSAYFAFEQIGNEVFILGETRFREDPLFTLGGPSGTPILIQDAHTNGVSGGAWILDLTGAPAACTLNDSTGPGLNGLQVGDHIHIEGLERADDDATIQAHYDTHLNGRVHEVASIVSQTVTLVTTIAGGSTVANGAGTTVDQVRNIHRVRFPRSQASPGTSGIAVYDSDYNNRPDDPDALTVWRVISGISLIDPALNYDRPACYPAWVANRQRDFGDNAATDAVEGIIYDGSPGAPIKGLSRREQRRLPYRPSVVPALDRLILGCPQYGCLFQVPALASIDPSLWPGGRSTTTTGAVVPWNGVYDRPRALGIPKARLVESWFTEPLTPGVGPGTAAERSVLNSWWTGLTPADNAGLSTGTYKMAITWYDPATGEEGLPSDTVTIDVPPANDFGTAWIRVAYLHPGYHFCETYVFRMNVYLSAAGGEALAFYGSFDMVDVQELTSITNTRQVRASSSVYGATHTTPLAVNSLVRWFDLPLPGTSQTDISPYLDSTRLAPASASMPRGAEACRYIRGVLFAGGSLGNSGPNGQMWAGRASAIFTGENQFFDGQSILIRAHGKSSAAIPGGDIDGTPRTSTLGIAGRCFPDAYQGIEMLEENLLPGSQNLVRVEQVLNRRLLDSQDFTVQGSLLWMHHERLRVTNGVSYYDRWRSVDTTPQDPPNSYDVTDTDVRYLMPRGQLQIGDPGEPGRSSPAFIKIVDPNDGDDIRAIGHLGGSAIVCTQSETYSYSWYRNPAGEEPQLMSNEFGCIGANTMVEFDGGLAWLSSRGPVAIGQGLQHVGSDVAENFYGRTRRYLADKTGMMRHSWGAHDAQRGLVLWGLVTRNGRLNIETGVFEPSIQWEGSTVSAATSENLTDEQMSRMPCDEVLIWSYRANAFSTWRPPVGLEVYWMRELRAADGQTRMCFLAADGRIYALDDEMSDRGKVSFSEATFGDSDHVVETTNAGSNSATLTFQHPDGHVTDANAGQRNLAPLIRFGMLVEFLDDAGNVTFETTVGAVNNPTATTVTPTSVTMSAPATWSIGQKVRLSARQRATIVSNYIGAETSDTMSVDAVQVRYTNAGKGSSNARVTCFKSEEGYDSGATGREQLFSQTGVWEALGFQDASQTVPTDILKLGRRKRFSQGRIEGQEIAVQIEITGEAQTRIQDISLEVG